LGVFYAQNIHRGLLEIAKQFEVVLNSGLGKRPVIAGEECPRFGWGIRRHNQPLRMRIPDSGLEVLYLPIPDTLNDSAYALVLRAYFAANAQHRASKDGTALFLKFGQMVMHIIKIPIEPFERRMRRQAC